MKRQLGRLQTSGFTIIELIIVVVIIGLLATIVFVAYTGVQSSARDSSVLSDLDALDGIQTQYGIKNNVGGKAWYSGSGIDTDLKFTPSPGNVIDVVVNASEYCIRGYNSGGTKNSISNAYTKASSDDACSLLAPSIAAGGSGDASLIGWWKFNGNATDSSGNSNNGSVTTASLTTGQNGQSNGAYNFDGSSSSIYVSDKEVTYPMTMSVWYKADNNNYRGHILYTREISGDGWGSEPETHLSQDYTSYGAYVKSGTCTLNIAFGTVDLNWHYIVFVLDTTYVAYVDGVVATTGLLGCTPNFASTVDQLRIGRPVSANRYLDGTLDDIRIYNRGLSLSEVQALYTAGAR